MVRNLRHPKPTADSDFLVPRRVKRRLLCHANFREHQRPGPQSPPRRPMAQPHGAHKGTADKTPPIRRISGRTARAHDGGSMQDAQHRSGRRGARRIRRSTTSATARDARLDSSACAHYVPTCALSHVAFSQPCCPCCPCMISGPLMGFGLVFRSLRLCSFVSFARPVELRTDDEVVEQECLRGLNVVERDELHSHTSTHIHSRARARSRAHAGCL